MSHTSTHHDDGAGWYELRLAGHLPSRWAVWFDDLTLTTHSDGTTTIAGHVVDQAALHGLLGKVRDVGLRLISVNRIDPDQADAAHTAPQSVPTKPRQRSTPR